MLLWLTEKEKKYNQNNELWILVLIRAVVCSSYLKNGYPIIPPIL